MNLLLIQSKLQTARELMIKLISKSWTISYKYWANFAIAYEIHSGKGI